MSMKMERKAEIIKELEERHHGEVTPDILIAEARSKRIPDLHDHFDWNADAALERSLKDQARAFISSVTVWYTHKNHSYSTVVYVRDPSKPTRQQGYRSIQYLRDNATEARKSVLLECKNAESALTRARTHALVLGHFELIDELLTRLHEVMEEMRPARGARGNARRGTLQESL